MVNPILPSKHGNSLLNLPKKVLANILLEGFGEEKDGDSLLKSSEFGDGAYTCRENINVISKISLLPVIQ